MSNNLRILLVVFALILLAIILRLIANRRLPIRYSLFWILSAFLIFMVGCFPYLVELATNFFGFIGASNFVIGILITLLLIMTLMLTLIVSKQKNQIKLLIQEVSILKAKVKEENNGK